MKNLIDLSISQGFFEEIEDIKYALHQSAKLNRIYEKTLWKMCQQFGVPYPHPEKVLERDLGEKQGIKDRRKCTS